MQSGPVRVYSNIWSMADRVIKAKWHNRGESPPVPLTGVKWCARAASETSVSRQVGFVKKGGKTLLFVEYHE